MSKESGRALRDGLSSQATEPVSTHSLGPSGFDPSRYRMSDELRAALERARHHVMTPDELFEQRVSFVYGQQDHDSPNPKSKDEIRALLMDVQGCPPCPCCQGKLTPEREERMARAIAANKRGFKPDHPRIDRVWTTYVGQARAAFAALRDSDGSPKGGDAEGGSVACDDSAGRSEAEASPNV